ncbi:MAG: argininosuccinate lyase [Candidatus Thermoplasmatota archaeon]|nr:argininosuccinate lyase [Candidatus Thermoplasmatota archaeon]
MARRTSTRSSRTHARSVSDDFLEFTSSVHFDHRLWRYDIAGSIAHANALADAGVLTQKELRRTVTGLRRIAKELSEGRLELDPKLEDVHMNVESLLTSLIGGTGAKLHTGRSRNDQVALDMRLISREMILDTVSEILALQDCILDKAKESGDSLLPGYTHLQHAQPVLLSHHLLAHFWRLDRDIERLIECYGRTNISPLGAGALAGTTFDLNRLLVAEMLGMEGVTANSMDAVSDRDFVAELAFDLALIMVHLTSLCEELILWASQEFGFVILPAGLAGGSSMMPQKRNPDIAELVRGKSGRAVGHLIAVLTLLKSLPLAYNRDLQEDKENLFDASDTVEVSLRALTTFLAEIEFDRERMGKAAEVGLMTATDLADFLASKGIPFRKAHSAIRKISIESGGDERRFAELASDAASSLLGYKSELPDGFLSPMAAVERRNVEGGTSAKAVKDQIKKAKRSIQRTRDSIASMRTQCAKVHELVRT